MRILDLEFQDAGFTARHDALDSVNILLILKNKDYFGTVARAVDQGVILFACLPKQCPGDGIQQG